jgi:hypothetical protein
MRIFRYPPADPRMTAGNRSAASPTSRHARQKIVAALRQSRRGTQLGENLKCSGASRRFMPKWAGGCPTHPSSSHPWRPRPARTGCRDRRFWPHGHRCERIRCAFRDEWHTCARAGWPPQPAPGVLKRLFGEIGFRSFARGFFLPRGTIIPILFVAIPAGEHCNAR